MGDRDQSCHNPGQAWAESCWKYCNTLTLKHIQLSRYQTSQDAVHILLIGFFDCMMCKCSIYRALTVVVSVSILVSLKGSFPIILTVLRLNFSICSYSEQVCQCRGQSGFKYNTWSTCGWTISHLKSEASPWEFFLLQGELTPGSSLVRQ